MIRKPVLVGVLRDPAHLRSLALSDWDLLLRQAARAEMTAILLGIVEDAGLLGDVPAAPREHLEWIRVVAARHQRAVRFEVAKIQAALEGLALPLILLKGAAYAVAGLPAAAGRMFSDVDILVPKERLDEVEAALMLHGWAGTHQDEYDQRYYRVWMHELPPMQHIQRGNSIDVHHAIVPETARARPDPGALRAAAVPVPGSDKLWMLAPHDMLLHSAVHLFSEGELHHGLRGLLDIHRLLLHFGPSPGFWEGLPARAVQLGLARPLFYALRYAGRLLGTTVPEAVLAQVAAAGRPSSPLLALMDSVFLRTLIPQHPSCDDRFSAPARGALYLRGNWLRMPPLMLARHLFHKAFISPKSSMEQI
jgi:hypothetical protein